MEGTYVDTVHAWTFSDAADAPPRLHNVWQASKLDLRMALRTARRMVFDEAMVHEVVRKANTQPGKMLAYCDLANLPFDKLWIEYDHTWRLDAQFANGTIREERDPAAGGPCGWLLERRWPNDAGCWTASYFANRYDNDTEKRFQGYAAPAFTSYGVDLSGNARGVDSTFVESLIAAGRDYDDPLMQLVAAMPWGYAKAEPTGNRLAYLIDDALAVRGAGRMERRFFFPVLDHVRRNIGTLYDEDASDGLIGRFVNQAREGRGDLRFLICALAMLNTCPIEYRRREAKGFIRRRLRNVPYLEHSTLTINCGRKRIQTVIDHAFKSELTRRRAHEVRGHWRNVDYGTAKITRACTHEPIERDGDYALCGKCSHLLRWIDHYQTGDATLGLVTHNYKGTYKP